MAIYLQTLISRREKKENATVTSFVIFIKHPRVQNVFSAYFCMCVPCMCVYLYYVDEYLTSILHDL